MRVPYPLLVRLDEVEAPDPQVQEVFPDTFLRRQERLELPQVDVDRTML